MTHDDYYVAILTATLLLAWLGWDEITGKKKGKP
jgi:hypothetical protein